MLKKVRLTRYGAIGLLILTLVKLCLYYIWRLGGLCRIGALIGLALVLVPGSLLYARFLALQKDTSGSRAVHPDGSVGLSASGL
ncbi:MAG: hypothetical protein N2255_00010 [Kiritimatiellae bacterium]|nr:hypothetical protein [Kiritimatiellia bacterium]